MTIFEMLGYDTRSFIHGAVYATLFCIVSWLAILTIASLADRRRRRYKRYLDNRWYL